jgi:hypothetical protein
MENLLKERVVIFWLGMVFGLSISAIIVGNDMVPRAVLENKRVYINGKFCQIKEIK